MQIVIEIDEEIYKGIKMGMRNRDDMAEIGKAVENGTQLPKGHGRLIDIGKYEKEYFNVAIQYDDGNHIHSDYTNTIPTIIEADKEESEEISDRNMKMWIEIFAEEKRRESEE